MKSITGFQLQNSIRATRSVIQLLKEELEDVKETFEGEDKREVGAVISDIQTSETSLVSLLQIQKEFNMTHTAEGPDGQTRTLSEHIMLLGATERMAGVCKRLVIPKKDRYNYSRERIRESKDPDMQYSETRFDSKAIHEQSLKHKETVAVYKGIIASLNTKSVKVNEDLLPVKG